MGNIQRARGRGELVWPEDEREHVLEGHVLEKNLGKCTELDETMPAGKMCKWPVSWLFGKAHTFPLPRRPLAHATKNIVGQELLAGNRKPFRPLRREAKNGDVLNRGSSACLAVAKKWWVAGKAPVTQ